MLMVNQLCGFGAGGREALTSIVQQASATSTAQTVNAPADIQAGDLLVLADLGTAILSTPATVEPPGFNTIINTSGAPAGTGARQIFSYKIADGSEGSTTITGMNGGSSNNKVLLVFRGNVPIVTATPNTFAGQVSALNPSAQNVAASGGTPPLVIFGIYGVDNSASVNPRTFTVAGSPAKDGEVGNSSSDLFVAWKIYLTAPADASIDMDDEGNANVLQSGYIALT
jgi:hypothetical protein